MRHERWGKTAIRLGKEFSRRGTACAKAQKRERTRSAQESEKSQWEWSIESKENIGLGWAWRGGRNHQSGLQSHSQEFVFYAKCNRNILKNLMYGSDIIQFYFLNITCFWLDMSGNRLIKADVARSDVACANVAVVKMDVRSISQVEWTGNPVKHCFDNRTNCFTMYS